jgi:hypothetical protein
MKKLLAACSMMLVLSACGFSPMYRGESARGAETANIYIAPIEGTNGIELRNYLILAWNTPNIPESKYSLSVKLAEPATFYKAIQKTGDATWEEIRITASWTFSRGGEVIAKSSETAAESYTFVSDLVSANASKTSATGNAIRAIGEKIEMKVNAKLKNIK